MDYGGRPAIVKERFAKKYRHPTLDKKINNQRVQTEAKMLVRVRGFGIDAPAVYFVDKVNKRIVMEHILGVSFKSYIYQHQTDLSEDMREKAKKVGQAIGDLHKNDIIHGDLTTSNMLIRPNGQIVLSLFLYI
uniref:non-specific serine/threonine protein kinase n=1 Tax=Arcella intermedia TaxID=1963864 RepID=A0A6B2LP35_9EUKA